MTERSDDGPSDPARLDGFMTLLGDGLLGRIHTCPHCKQRDVCHGVPDVGTVVNGTVVDATARDAMVCWRCETKLAEALHWSNGLDLNLDCHEQETTGRATSGVPLAHRREWRALQTKWGELSRVSPHMERFYFSRYSLQVLRIKNLKSAIPNSGKSLMPHSLYLIMPRTLRIIHQHEGSRYS